MDENEPNYICKKGFCVAFLKKKIVSYLLEQCGELMSSTSMIVSMLDPRHKHLSFRTTAQRVSANAKLVGLGEVAVQRATGDEVT